MATNQLQIQNPLHVTAAASAAATTTATASHIRAKMLKSASYKETESSSYAAAAKESKDVSKKRCLCAPTTHAGSFRCRLHRAISTQKSSSASSQSTGCDDIQKHSWWKISRPMSIRFCMEVAAAAGFRS